MALVSGVAAKEIVVSTLGVLYSVENADENTASLSSRLKSSGGYSPAAALAMMIFVLLYFPCIATIVAISQEAGGWRWALFSVLYNTALAWVLAWVVYRLALMVGL